MAESIVSVAHGHVEFIKDALNELRTRGDQDLVLATTIQEKLRDEPDTAETLLAMLIDRLKDQALSHHIERQVEAMGQTVAS